MGLFSATEGGRRKFGLFLTGYCPLLPKTTSWPRLKVGLSGVGVSEYKKKFLSVKKKIEPLEWATTDAQRALRGREAAKEYFRVTNEYPGGAPMRHMVEFDQC